MNDNELRIYLLSLKSQSFTGSIKITFSQGGVRGITVVQEHAVNLSMIPKST